MSCSVLNEFNTLHRIGNTQAARKAAETAITMAERKERVTADAPPDDPAFGRTAA